MSDTAARPRPVARYRAVLVPLDGSEQAERGIGPGEWLAERFGADLHVLCADVQRDERFWYDTYLERIAADTVGIATHRSNERDVDRAVRVAAGALGPCLVCMATHGRSRSAAVLGSTFASVLAGGIAPLIAIGPRAGPRAAPDPRRVVASVDDGPGAGSVVDLAASWARALGDSLSVVTVAERDDDGVHDQHVQGLAHRPDLADLVTDATVLLGGAGPHHELARHLAHRPASLVVAATRGRRGVARALYGSELARIIHESPVPVLAASA
jgi:nucleotide-binding universal stress UspA family protein